MNGFLSWLLDNGPQSAAWVGIAGAVILLLGLLIEGAKPRHMLACVAAVALEFPLMAWYASLFPSIDGMLATVLAVLLLLPACCTFAYAIANSKAQEREDEQNAKYFEQEEQKSPESKPKERTR